MARSRFGYLGSTLASQASSGLQADAYVRIMDRLGMCRRTSAANVVPLLTWLTARTPRAGQNTASCSRVIPDRRMFSMVRARSAAKSSPATMDAMWITASIVGVGTDTCRARSVRNTIE